MFDCNAVFLSQETAEEFEKLFVENEVLKDSVAGLQKKYRNVAETNEVGERKHLHSCFNRSRNLCVVNTSNRMTKTKKTNRINLFSGFINQDKIENLLSRRTAVKFAQMRNARARRAKVQSYID